MVRYWAGPIIRSCVVSLARGHGESPRGAAAPPPPPPASHALADLALRLPALRLRRAPPPFRPAPGRAGRLAPPGRTPPGPSRNPYLSSFVIFF